MSELVKVKEVTGAKCNSCCEVFNADTIETEKPYRIVRDKEYIFNYRDTVCAKCEEKIAEEAKVLFEEGKQLYNSGNYKEAKAKFEKAKKKGHKQADEWINKATSRSGSISSSSKEWYEDGNLHKATVAQWKNASYQNKLATASDWLAATIWKGHLTSPNDFVRLKVKSQMLVNAIDEAVKAEGIDEQQINEIAAALVMMSDDLGP